MNLRRRAFDRFKLLGFTMLSVAALSTGVASARTETIRWTDSNSGLAERWEAHVGATPGNYDQVIQLSNPELHSGGVLQSSIEVADEAVVYIAIRAIGSSGERSPFSNERERLPAATGGGEDPPDGGGTTPGGGGEDPPDGGGTTPGGGGEDPPDGGGSTPPAAPVLLQVIPAS